MIRTLDGCSCDEGPVIILEDAIIGDVSIVSRHRRGHRQPVPNTNHR